jgi:hypothetical protein
MSAKFDGDNHRGHGLGRLVQILGLWGTRVCCRLLVFEDLLIEVGIHTKTATERVIEARVTIEVELAALVEASPIWDK